MSTQPPTPSPAPPTRPASRTPVVFLAIAGASVLAAGVGGYVAQSHRQTQLPTVEARAAQPAAPTTVADTPAAPPTSASDAAPEPASTPDMAPADAAVTHVESEAVAVPVEPLAAARRRTAREPLEKPRPRVATPAPERRQTRVAASSPSPAPPVQAPPPTRTPAPPVQAPPPTRTPEPAPAVETTAPDAPAVVEALPAPAPTEPATRPQGARVSIEDTFTIPADSVIGLELEHSVSSETAQLEDRVDARVARDVRVEGTVVIPAGSRVRGAVTRVEHGGRFKERARIEIRFDTLILAGGDTQSIATDTLFREGDNVGRKAGARIGATAAGGALIGAIFGGEKGAAIGAAAGAGAGTAVTAAQKPSEARFRAGSVVTVRLTAPVSITVQQ